MFLTQKSSTKIYYINFKQSNGKRTSRSTGTTKKHEALKFLSEFNNDQLRNDANRIIPTLIKDYFRHFLIVQEPQKTYKTIQLFKTTFKFFVEYTGNIELSTISKKTIIEYLDFRVKNPSIYRARIDLINLSSAFNKAIDEGYLVKNPCKGIKQFKLPQKAPKYFSTEEYNLLLDSIKEQWFKYIVELAYNTGMRQMEILTLRWNQVDFTNETITLNNHFFINKGKKVRTVYLSKRVNEILNSLFQERSDELIFHYNHQQFKQDHITKKFKKYIRRINVNQSLNFHSLRHTFASRLVQKGVSLYVVQKLLGHADIKTTQIYSHLRNDNLKNAVKQLDV